mgnify:CR=1 FL=1
MAHGAGAYLRATNPLQKTIILYCLQIILFGKMEIVSPPYFHKKCGIEGDTDVAFSQAEPLYYLYKSKVITVSETLISEEIRA